MRQFLYPLLLRYLSITRNLESTPMLRCSATTQRQAGLSSLERALSLASRALRSLDWYCAWPPQHFWQAVGCVRSTRVSAKRCRHNRLVPNGFLNYVLEHEFTGAWEVQKHFRTRAGAAAEVRALHAAGLDPSGSTDFPRTSAVGING